MDVLFTGSVEGSLSRAAGMAASRGIKVRQATDTDVILKVLRREPQVSLILVELPFDIPGLITLLRAERFNIPIVACGLGTSAFEAAQAIEDGAQEFLPLPPDADQIAMILQAASGDPHVLIASDPSMVTTVQRAEKIAASDASVLVTGESGTGKEVLARLVHKRSRRAKGPFVALNCAAIPESLLESELFGHEKGAFSGAAARRIGKFESADGGTILLDEISEMDIRLQAKLLRVIQEREIDRLGGTNPVKIDVRVIATSNRDLKSEISAGRFRQDLYFRLNVISLHIPALFQRPNDVPKLAVYFEKHYANVNGKSSKSISADALDRLQNYRWPGNVRELENTIHRAVLLSSGDTIAREDIELTEDYVVKASEDEPGDAHVFIGRTIESVERKAILQTLEHTLGNRTHAAVILGISIRCLRNKLRDYAVDDSVAVRPPNSHAA